MRKKRGVSIQLLVVTLVALLLATACGGSGGANSLGGIPDPPKGAEPMSDEDLGMSAEDLAEASRLTMGVSKAEVEAYVLPRETPYAEIESYYAGLLGDNWVVQETDAVLQARSQGIEAKIWRNEEKGQTLSVQYVDAEALGGSVLLVLYAED
jgi:hypothetical protein